MKIEKRRLEVELYRVRVPSGNSLRLLNDGSFIGERCRATLAWVSNQQG